MGPVKFVALLPARRASRRPRCRSRSTRTPTVPTVGASGAVAAVLGGYLLLFPRARVITVIFIIFFFTIIELPALLFLGDLVRPAGAVRLLRPRPTPAEGGGVAYFAHIGGFVFGLAAIKLFASERRRTTADRAGRRPDVRTAVTAVALVFVCAMAFATVYVLLTEGPDLLSLIGVLVVALLAFGDASARSRSRRGAVADALHAVPGRSPAPPAACAAVLALLLLLAAGAAALFAVRERDARRPPRQTARRRRPARALQRRRHRAAGRRRHRAVAARGAARRPARRGAAPLQAPAAGGPAVRRRHRAGAVAARPDARAADRVADEDDDRARRRRPRRRAARRCGSPRRRCATAAPASGCSRAASGSA